MAVFVQVGLVASAASLRASGGKLGYVREAEGRGEAVRALCGPCCPRPGLWSALVPRPSCPGALLAVPGSHSAAGYVSAPELPQLRGHQWPCPLRPPVPPAERDLGAAHDGSRKPRHAVWQTRDGEQGQPGTVRAPAWGWAAVACLGQESGVAGMVPTAPAALLGGP